MKAIESTINKLAIRQGQDSIDLSRWKPADFICLNMVSMGRFEHISVIVASILILVDVGSEVVALSILLIMSAIARSGTRTK